MAEALSGTGIHPAPESAWTRSALVSGTELRERRPNQDFKLAHWPFLSSAADWEAIREIAWANARRFA